MNGLFDHIPPGRGARGTRFRRKKEEGTSLDRLKDLDTKIAEAIGKVKALKEENAALEAKVRELENSLAEKEKELRSLSSEKVNIKDQIAELLNELESIEIS